MYDDTLDAKVDAMNDNLKQRECPICGGEVAPLYWYKDGVQGDLIEYKCEECTFTDNNSQETKIL